MRLLGPWPAASDGERAGSDQRRSVASASLLLVPRPPSPLLRRIIIVNLLVHPIVRHVVVAAN